MKFAVKLFCILIVGIVVFTGALMISEGLRVHRQASDAPFISASSVIPFLATDSFEGSAL